MIQLDDLLASYPSLTPMPPNIQNQVTSKQEFSELVTGPRESQPGPGQFFKHQELIGRYVIWADRLMIIAGTGTGKGCSIVRCAEYYKRQFAQGGNIKQAIILVKGPSLIREFRRQIVCACTAGEYITPLVLRSTDEERRKSNITREVNKWYTLSTYVTFIMRFPKRSRIPLGELRRESPRRRSVASSLMTRLFGVSRIPSSTLMRFTISLG